MGERTDVARAVALMAEALCEICAEALDGGRALYPTLMIWYEGEDLGRAGAVVVFEPAADPPARAGDALLMARQRLPSFTREATGWALAYEGLVSGNGTSSAAVMIEVALRRPSAQTTLARHYRPRAGSQPFAWTGDLGPG